jgi:hypothetical protein
MHVVLRAFGIASVLCVAAPIFALSAEKTAAPAADATSPPPATAATIDPDAMKALDKMGVALRSHKTFVVKSNYSSEDVLSTGQKLQYSGTAEIQARRPDHFVMSISSDTKSRNIYFDGKALTIVAPVQGYYASFDAPGTIIQVVDKAQEKYGMELPLADLFSWGVDPSLTKRIQTAMLVRAEHVDGQLCNHYAFRQQKVDWQVWIAADTSLPCKLVITNKTDPTMPQYTSVMSWSFPDRINDSVFAFAPTASDHKIVMATLAGAASPGAKQ